MNFYRYGEVQEGEKTQDMYLVYNNDNSPVRVLHDGKTLGAKERAWIKSDENVFPAAIATGRLIVLKEPTPYQPPTNNEQETEPQPPTPTISTTTNNDQTTPSKKTTPNTPRKKRAPNKKPIRP